ncbi:MAG: hypothetical protein CL840_17665 [Crocinitomicaceae bacterium]|nr:hypothetical protein [Crocinitomicaceae bacterium]|tara:strand:+ start:3544 stop:4719 length:1176 start_codon:yes stop_codon:yes gene_type:complete
MKAVLSSLLVILFASSSIAQNNWSLSGNNIYNNNSGFVGINQQSPTAYLQINTTLFDYGGAVEQGDPIPCFAGTTALKLIGTSWEANMPNETFICDPHPGFPNLFEGIINLGTSTNQAPSGPPVYVTNYTPIRRVTIDAWGKLGIGDNLDPTQDLDVAGNIRMRTGAQNGYIATSDANGNMTWQPASNTGYWQPMTASTPGTDHIKNKFNGEVHIGNEDHALFFDPSMINTEHSMLTKTGDVGMFFGATSSTPEPGLVIAAKNMNGNGLNGMRIDWNGSVTIGTNSNYVISQTPYEAYKLAVHGKVIAELVRVKLKSDWPDFVFMENHDLMTLSELEKFIELNGHLPDVPSASEVEKEGIDLGEKNRVLLQKIEELTLYVIELEKRIEQLD